MNSTEATDNFISLPMLDDYTYYVIPVSYTHLDVYKRQ